MTNPWIEHLKQYASKKNITYAQAIKDPKARASYKPKTVKSSKGGAVYGDRDEEEMTPTPPSGRVIRKAIVPKRPSSTGKPMGFTMGKPPATPSSDRPIKKGIVPVRPFSMGKEPAKAPVRRQVRVSAPPNGYISPIPVLKKFMFPARLAKKPTEMSLKELKFRAESIVDAIDGFQSDGYLTEVYAKTLVGDVQAVLDRGDLSVSRKHDLLTNIVKEIRTEVDAMVSGRDAPDPQAF